jgi:hypothetical protein
MFQSHTKMTHNPSMKLDADRRRRIRNDLRARLATDPEFRHVWLCHDGMNHQCAVSMGTAPHPCHAEPEPARLRFAESDLEVPPDENI